MSTRLFISRSLKEDSPFWTHFSTAQITHFSLLTFKPIPFRVHTADWVFFYSTKAVLHYLNEQTTAQQVRFACYGLATAKALAAQGFSPHFIGNTEPKATALAWQQLLQEHSHIVFATAEHSLHTLAPYMKQHQCDRINVYSNEERQDWSLEEMPDYLIFTSPRNAASFLRKYQPQKSKIIAIGNTTRQYLIDSGFSEVYIPAEPNEEALAALVQRLEKAK